MRAAAFAALTAMLAVTLTIAADAAAAASVWFVDDTATGVEDGTSWADAFPKLDDALAAASAGDEIQVAEGTYKNGSSGFALPAGISLRGGYPDGGGTTANAALHPTILTGDDRGDDAGGNYNDNAATVLTINNTVAEVSGFIISGGTSSGVFAGKDNPSLRNLVVTQNPGYGVIFDSSSNGRLVNSTISNNGFGGTAADAGVRVAEAVVEIFNSQITGNVGDLGSGVLATDSNLTLVNSLIADNAATDEGGGVFADKAVVELVNSTVANNSAANGGGAIQSNDDVTLSNSIVWGNTAPTDPGVAVGGNLNLQSSNVQGLRPAGTNISTDPLFVDATNGDFRVMPGSPVVDVGDDLLVVADSVDVDEDGDTSEAAPDLDLAGRISDLAVDMGAYEFVDVCPTDVYVDTSVAGGNGLTWATAFADLQDALALAASLAGTCAPGDIHIAQGTYTPDTADRTVSFDLVDGWDVIGGYDTGGAAGPDNVAYPTILSGDLLGDDSGAGSNAENSIHVVTVGSTVTVSVSHLTIGDGNADSGTAVGGGIETSGNLTLDTATVQGNVASVDGGGIEVASGSLTLIDSTVTGNSAGQDGGGINLNSSSALSIGGGSFDQNSAVDGGAVYAGSGAILTIDGVSFSQNAASDRGGALRTANRPAAVTNSNFNGNTAGQGGAMFVWSASLTTIVGSTFTSNSASDSGGGAIYSTALLRVTDSTFDANEATGIGLGKGSGGALRIQNNDVDLIDVTVINSVATGTGGGIWTFGNVDIVNSTIDSNTASSGGGIYFTRDLDIVNTVISRNTATSEGGAIANQMNNQTPNIVVATVTNATIADNVPDGIAGTGFNRPFEVRNSILWNPAGDEIDFGTVEFSNIEGGFPGSGNIDTDPQFANPVAGDYRTAPFAPGVDAGDTAAVPSDVFDVDSDTDVAEPTPDRDLDERVQGTAVDQGAYEVSPAVDTDGDQVADDDEDLDGDGDLTDDDSDGDRIPNYLDTDDDDDGVLTILEAPATRNADGDALPDYLDDDSDNDTLLDGDEDTNLNGALDPGETDRVDADTDDDTVDDGVEDTDGNGTATNDDSDSDGTIDALDIDDDGDGIDTINEDANGNGDPTDDDSDGDTIPDYLDDEVTGARLYVDIDATGANDGTSWADAFTDLQSALAIAVATDEVWIADGTYRPSAGVDRSASFVINDGVDLYGGFVGTEIARTERDVENNPPAILSGDTLGDDDNGGSNIENAYNVVTIAQSAGSAGLDGLTITAGNANGFGATANGAGIYVASGTVSLVLESMSFVDNVASGDGGAVYKELVGSPNATIRNSTFSGNTAANAAAVNWRLADITIADSTFSGNTVTGAGSSRSIVRGGATIAERIEMTGNGLQTALSADELDLSDSMIDATTPGRAIDVSSMATVRMSIIVGDVEAGDLIIEDSSITGNGDRDVSTLGFNEGIIIRRSTLDRAEVELADDNGTIVENTLILGTGTAFSTFSGDRSLRIDNSTISGKTTVFDVRSDTDVDVNNSVIWGNAEVFDGTANDTIRNTIVPGISGSGNIDADPQFFDPSNANYRLGDTSPGIDAGNNLLVPAGPDLDGETRIQNATVDMGAYEGGETQNCPTELRVDGDATGAGDGSSWADAYTLVQDALTFVGANCPLGLDVWIADGTYLPDTNDRAASFDVPRNTALYGGFVGTEALLADRDVAGNPPVVLSGDLAGDDGADIVTDNSYNVVNLTASDGSNTIDGVTVSGGFAEGVSSFDQRGGGITTAAAPSTVTLRAVSLVGNEAQANGGGAYLQAIRVEVVDSTFSSNSAEAGGGLYVRGELDISGSVFADNTAVNGAGGGVFASNQENRSEIADSTFSGNSATQGGGAINVPTGRMRRVDVRDNDGRSGGGVNFSDSSFSGLSNEVIDSTVVNNTASDDGGGIRSGRRSDLVNVVITGNVAAGDGGGYYESGTTSSSNLINSLVADNVAGAAGGGLATFRRIDISSSTIANNTASTAGGAMFLNRDGSDMVNSIVWGNTAPQDPAFNAANLNFTHSNVQGLGGTATNLDVDPQFTGVDYRLLVGSPMLDVGSAQDLEPDTYDIDQDGVTFAEANPDLDLEDRIQGIGLDLGAYEGAEPVPALTVLPQAEECFDSRDAGSGGTFTGQEVRTIQVAGVGGCVPAGATAVIFTVSSVDPLTEGNLRMTPAGVVATGGAGVVNYGAANGLNNTNTVTVPLSASGAVDIQANAGPLGTVPTTDVRLVALGYYASGSNSSLRFVPLNPCAVADSRPNKGASDAFDGPAGDGFWPVGADFPDVDVVGEFDGGQGGQNGIGGTSGITDCGVASGAEAVLINVVTIAPQGGSGFVSVGPGGLDPQQEAVSAFAPLTAVVSGGFNNGATTVVPLNGGDTIALDIDSLLAGSSAKTRVRVEVLGYYDDDPAGFEFRPVTPCAAFDSRSNKGATGNFEGERQHGLGFATAYQISGDMIPLGQGGVVDTGAGVGSCGVPDGASAVLINLEAVNALQEGNLWVAAATPTAGAATSAGVLNFNNVTPKMNNANTVVVPLSADGKIDVEINAGSFTADGTSITQVRGIILGYYN